MSVVSNSVVIVVNDNDYEDEHKETEEDNFPTQPESFLVDSKV